MINQNQTNKNSQNQIPSPNQSQSPNPPGLVQIPPNSNPNQQVQFQSSDPNMVSAIQAMLAIIQGQGMQMLPQVSQQQFQK
jgi:hypothetical protein